MEMSWTSDMWMEMNKNKAKEIAVGEVSRDFEVQRSSWLSKQIQFQLCERIDGINYNSREQYSEAIVNIKPQTDIHIFACFVGGSILLDYWYCTDQFDFAHLYHLQ